MKNVMKFYEQKLNENKLFFIKLYDVLTKNLIKFVALTLLLFIHILPAAQANYNWTELTITTDIPSVRYFASMAFDPTIEKIILFGGLDGNDCLNDTWVFDGTGWTELTPPVSPTARRGASMAFDPSIEKIILFGGDNLIDYFNDTWVFDGTGWTELTPAVSPPVRRGATMAFDPVRELMILFGGRDSNINLNDTWAFNGTNWVQLHPTNSPPARLGASMAFDPATEQMILFGGWNGANYLNDNWAFDGENWVQFFPTDVPSGRRGASMDVDSSTGQMILFGGQGDNGYFNDTWVFDGTNWSQVTFMPPAVIPTARYYASMGFDTSTEQMILFGGLSDSGYLNDTWALSSTQPAPPNNLSGFQKKNDFGTFYELFSTLKWEASSSAISGYYVYRNGALIATLGATTFEYSDHNNAKDEKITYSVTAFDSSGGQSSPVYITIP